MQFSSRWLWAIGTATVCLALCLSVEVSTAQNPIGASAQSVPAAPIVLNLSPIASESPSLSAAEDPDAASGTTRLVQKKVVAKHAKSSNVKSSRAERGKESKTGWVKPLAVISQLETLSSISVTQQWASEVQSLIELLLEESLVSSAASATILTQLDTKVLELEQIIGVINQQFAGLPAAQSLASQLHRLHYDLSKRTVIWRAIQKLPATSVRLSDTQFASSQRLNFDFLNQDWQEYLQIQPLDEALSALQQNAKAKTNAARRSLARMASPALSSAQRSYLNHIMPVATVTAIKQVATGELNQYRLLKAIEWNEQNPSGVATHYINDQFQSLMWSPDSQRQFAATQLQAHYRNANIRLAVSQNMLNRLIPDSPAVHEPVHEQILGADVRGHSQIRNRLSVQLVEDPLHIALRLRTDGEVDSDTVAKRSGFEIRNEGMANFHAFKKLTLDRKGRFSSDQPIASAQAKQRLIGMRSKLDPFPVVNWIARRLAKKKLDRQTPEATSLLEKKIERSASDKLQEGVESQVAQMQAYLKVNLLEPLNSMDLNPEALQLATTKERIVMRYRLAGIDQMAADTPRPQDSPYDYLSLQLHQSLLNNTIERIEIESQTFTPESLLQHLSEVIGFNPKNAGAESKHEAKFVFANYDAIRVDFVNDKIRIELNLKSLRVGKGKTWRNITVSATYLPTVEGSQVRLTQQGIIGVKGKRFRIGDQIAVRAIFNVVLPDSYQFDTVPQRLADQLKGFSLVITKLNIVDGWVGITFDEVINGYSTGPKIYEASGQSVIYPDGSSY